MNGLRPNITRVLTYPNNSNNNSIFNTFSLSKAYKSYVH